MKKIEIHGRTFRPLISHRKIENGIESIADRLNRDFKNSEHPPVFLCILNGAMFFTSSLLGKLDFNVELASLKASSYSGMQSTGSVRVSLPPTADVKGRKVTICDDMIDSGVTMRYLKKYLLELGAEEVRVCSLIVKKGNLHKRLVKEGLVSPEAGEDALTPFLPDYYAFDLQDDFIVGFGVDYDGLGRNLKDIYILDDK